MKLPKNLRNLVSLIQESGYEIYLVGGAIRDYLLNIKIDDYDLTTNMPCAYLIDLCEKNHLHYNDRGLKHDTIGVIYSGFYVEITSYRGLDKNKLEEDIKLRDFTINSLAYDLDNNKIIDLVDGQIDIKNKLIKSYYPDKIFILDPLRILRMYRFRAKYHFDIDLDTYSNAILIKNKLSEVAVERIRSELTYIIKYDPLVLTNMLQSGVLQIIFKDIYNIENKDKLIKDINNVYINHYDIVIKYALLFYLVADYNIDLAIKLTKNFTNKYAFSNQLKRDILKVLEILTLNNNLIDIELLIELICNHDYNDIDLKRSFIFLNIINKFVIKINNYKNIIKTKSLYLKKKRNKELLSANDLVINGNDIILYAHVKNKLVGEIKQDLFKLCLIDNSKNNREYLIEYLTRLNNK